MELKTLGNFVAVFVVLLGTDAFNQQARGFDIESTTEPIESLSQQRLQQQWIGQQAEPIEISDIQISASDDEIEVVLKTAKGLLSAPITSTNDRVFVADIENAVLVLPENEFVANSPAPGFEQVSATQIGPQQVRIEILGTEILPVVSAAMSSEGLTFSASAMTMSTGPMGEFRNEPSGESAEAETSSDQPAEGLRLIVTAEKRPEEVQAVPISLTAFSAEDIEDADISSLEQIAGATPNFSAYTPGRNFILYSIRGLSNFNFLSRDPAAFYVDNVPYDYTGFLDLDLSDLEQIEVLRGPQATLYGRNAQAGVVNIATRKPTNEPEYRLTTTLGNLISPEIRASASGPLIEDNLFFRLSGDFTQREGFLINTATGDDVDFESGGGARAQLLWQPSDNWDVLFNTSVNVYRDGTPPISRPDLGQDPSETDINAIGFNDLDTNTQALSVNYDGPSLRFTSITARRFSNQSFENDSDGTSLDQLEQFAAINSTSLSQELRLQSPEEDSPLSWLLGAYVENRDFNVDEEGFRIGADFGAPSESVTTAALNEETYAVFGQLSYRPVDPLTLTAGLRYEIFNSTLENSKSPALLGVTRFSDESNNGTELLPRFALEYEITPDVMAYGSIARGYRAQGVNFRAAVPEQLFFDEEQSWNYEVGLRSSWLEDRVTANLSLFHNPIEDYQVPSTDPATGLFGFVDNAGVTINGLEAELRARPVEGLDLTAGFGWLDATYTDYTDPVLGDFNGNRLTYSPDYTLNLAAQYRSTDGIFGRLEAQGVGTTFFDDANTLKQAPYILINARVGYEFRERQGLYLFANNLFDYRPLTTQASFFGGSLVPATYGAPASFGVQYRQQF